MNGEESGRVVVITGASDGIGAAAARALHARGDRVVVLGRSPEKTRAVAEELGSEYHVADLASLRQVRALGQELRRRHPRIDVLAANAGLIAGDRRHETEDGHELTFQVNHLAPFLLTMLLREPLVAARARVIVTASAAGRRAEIDLQDLDFKKRYSSARAYATTKAENMLFARELARRWGPDGVTAAAFHPGAVRSRWGHEGPRVISLFLRSPARYLLRSPERGAETLVWLATTDPSTTWGSGGYFADRKPARPNRLVEDAGLCRGLWERSEEMLGLS
ncbi:MAG: SDR family NAD(P)-dependent oxidoreductase [Candidatus Dormibacteraeota bacterium]|nr:SDR family NAD(P)-dependent oxidoreductase [Candidatus Dormibacteraeota bacterium]